MPTLLVRLAASTSILCVLAYAAWCEYESSLNVLPAIVIAWFMWQTLCYMSMHVSMLRMLFFRPPDMYRRFLVGPGYTGHLTIVRNGRILAFVVVVAVVAATAAGLLTSWYWSAFAVAYYLLLHLETCA
jgi:hypothetical protein